MGLVEELVADVSAVREDVAYIKAKIEVLPDNEMRLRGLERFRYAFPSISVISLLVAAAAAIAAFAH